jgi:hypothetical protein
MKVVNNIMQPNISDLNTAVNINNLDNIRGRRNLMNFAKQHNIKGYSKYRVNISETR